MSQDADILRFLRDLILDMKDAEFDVVQSSSTFEQLELDSLDFVELQVAVKKAYKVDLPPDMFVSGAISNLEQLVEFISTAMVAIRT
ncbi:hypothetical protein BGV71_10550 [Burkholderia ubonensis]|uniref:acyl carrier protein n=1 Tax=Burkholderia ubonensis TaxID=101571 RepID=UPI000759B20E|nr:acyl carrier protein [Burkholderia ubonensis]KVC86739.1 hypothetical protein WI76_04500 [Burkholderia ubonensis]KVZ28685.1 hypothetical protein WL13_32905 [Burkholderia ubonensis]KWC26453.1 hypothetical protein WL50_07595 [Burkholderia ubonensis]OJA86266.1 hypothetical protein BGV71_10550 [Burkholderia ubonensis]